MNRAKSVIQTLFFSTAEVKHYPRKECNTNAKERGWTRNKIILGWLFVYLYAASKGVAEHVYPSLEPFATSHFSGLALLSSKAVVSSAIFIVTRPAFAKIADHIGRLEGWIIVIITHALGSILYAAAPNIGCYFAGVVFWEIGTVGGHLMTELYASDTSTIETRVMFSSFIQSPNIWSPYAAAPVVGEFLRVTTWRWGYGAFALILPVCSIGTVLMFGYMRIKYERKMNALGDFYSPGGPLRFIQSFDVVGLVLLCAGMILFFFPITLAAGTEKWKKGSFIAMLTIGSFFIVCFPFWELFGAKSPLISWRLFRNRVMVCSAAIMFLTSMCQKLATPYYITWLLVVKGLTPKAATNVASAMVVSTWVCAIFVAAPYLWWRGRPKHMVFFGCVLYMIGVGLTYRFRRANSSLAMLIVSQCFEGVGRGFLYIPAGTMAQAMFDKHKVAKVTAVYFTAGGIGQIIGDAITGAIYRSVYPKQIHKYAPDIPKKDLQLIINKIKKATKFKMGTKVRTEINTAFDKTMQRMLLGPFGCAAAMLLFAALYPSIDLRSANDTESNNVAGDDIEPDDYAPNLNSRFAGAVSPDEESSTHDEKDERSDNNSYDDPNPAMGEPIPISK